MGVHVNRVVCGEGASHFGFLKPKTPVTGVELPLYKEGRDILDAKEAMVEGDGEGEQRIGDAGWAVSRGHFLHFPFITPPDHATHVSLSSMFVLHYHNTWKE